MKGSEVAVAYLRVSKARGPLSPQAQRAQIQRYADQEGIRIVAWHEDVGQQGARSGKLPIERRPGLQRAVHDVESGDAGVLLFAVRDRLTRKIEEAKRINRIVKGAGGRLVSACGTANGGTEQDAFVEDILYCVAEDEWRRASARFRAALAQKRSRGEEVGQPPFGFCNRGGRLVVCRREERILWAIASLRRRGFGYHSTCVELTRCGLFSRAGTPMDPTSVRRICQRLSIVAAGAREGRPLVRHVELGRPLVWRTYQRALREAYKIHPSRSADTDPPRPKLATGRFDRLNGLSLRV